MIQSYSSAQQTAGSLEAWLEPFNLSSRRIYWKTNAVAKEAMEKQRIDAPDILPWLARRKMPKNVRPINSWAL
jgi:hypothetical protein